MTASCVGLMEEICLRAYFRYRFEWLSSSEPACVPMRRLAFPGEELHVSGAIPVRTVITALSAVPALPVIPAKAGILIRVWTS